MTPVPHDVPQPDLLQRLRAAAGDLTYPSDSDEPFDPFAWPDAPGDAAAQVRGRAAHRPVEVVPAGRFFAELADADDADRFAALHVELGRLLSGLTVVRVAGRPEVDVYLIGRTVGGGWAGLHTVSVET